MDWVMGSNKQPLKSHHVYQAYNDQGVVTMEIETCYHYDDQNRIIEKEVIKTNHHHESVTEQVSYVYHNQVIANTSKSVFSQLLKMVCPLAKRFLL